MLLVEEVVACGFILCGVNSATNFGKNVKGNVFIFHSYNGIFLINLTFAVNL